MDLSHTATFSITVPAGDSYSTILGIGTPVPEPSGVAAIAGGLIMLIIRRRRAGC
jgi:hypothetical protein